jgi:salicylate hydroxylase
VAILGDAAHASTPHQGAGAGQALEDAFILSNLLGDPLVRVVADIPAAFKAYDAVRRPRSQKVVVTSREAGKVFCCEGEGVGDNTEKIRENLSHRQKWIWEVDHKEQLKKARAILEEEISRPEKQKQVKISA